MTGVHLVLPGRQEVELLLLDLLAGDGEHGLGETHGLEVAQSCSSHIMLVINVTNQGRHRARH